MKKILLAGAGRHFHFIADAIRLSGSYEIAGVLDPGLKKGSTAGGVRVLGGDDEAKKLFAKGVKAAFVSIGSIGDCSARLKAVEKFEKIGFKLPSIIHPAAVVAENARLGKGVFVGATAVVAPGAKIGDFAIINNAAVVGFECEIGRFAHIAPNATLGGCVKVGEFTHVGTGSAARQDIVIGKKCMIGVGSAVVKNIPDGAKAFGNPCRVRR